MACSSICLVSEICQSQCQKGEENSWARLCSDLVESNLAICGKITVEHGSEMYYSDVLV